MRSRIYRHYHENTQRVLRPVGQITTNIRNSENEEPLPRIYAIVYYHEYTQLYITTNIRNHHEHTQLCIATEFDNNSNVISCLSTMNRTPDMTLAALGEGKDYKIVRSIVILDGIMLSSTMVQKRAEIWAEEK